jgi:hypothetical protein
MNFSEFLNIRSVEDVPDEKTVCKYKGISAKIGTGDSLFAQFNNYTDSLRLIVNEEK